MEIDIRTVGISIATHNNERRASGFVYQQVNFWDIHESMTSGFSYSQYNFKGGYREGKNNLGNANIIFLDFDNGLSIEEAKDKFKKVSHCIVTTKSHRKDKNGVVCDRFRVAIPLNTPMNIPVSEYRDLLDTIYKRIGCVDPSTKDIARFFYSSPSDAYFCYGSSESFLDWTPFYRMMMLEKFNREKARKNTPKFVPSGRPQSNTLPADTTIETRGGVTTLGSLRATLSIGAKEQCKCVRGIDHGGYGRHHHSAFVYKSDNGNIYYRCMGARCESDGTLWCED